MRPAGKRLLILALFGLLAGIAYGCAPAKTCVTSLITLDETRLDANTYEQEAAETGDKVADLSSKLSKKQGELNAIKDEPARLEKKLHELKKGSGRE
jgi:uncharacterized coiled-coil DUF342 family protein